MPASGSWQEKGGTALFSDTPVAMDSIKNEVGKMISLRFLTYFVLNQIYII